MANQFEMIDGIDGNGLYVSRDKGATPSFTEIGVWNGASGRADWHAEYPALLPTGAVCLNSAKEGSVPGNGVYVFGRGVYEKDGAAVVVYTSTVSETDDAGYIERSVSVNPFFSAKLESGIEAIVNPLDLDGNKGEMHAVNGEIFSFLETGSIYHFKGGKNPYFELVPSASATGIRTITPVKSVYSVAGSAGSCVSSWFAATTDTTAAKSFGVFTVQWEWADESGQKIFTEAAGFKSVGVMLDGSWLNMSKTSSMTKLRSRVYFVLNETIYLLDAPTQYADEMPPAVNAIPVASLKSLWGGGRIFLTSYNGSLLANLDGAVYKVTVPTDYGG